MLDNPVAWIVLAALVVLVVVLVVVLRRETALEAIGIPRRRRPHRDEFRPEGSTGDHGPEGSVRPPPLKRAGIVVNPTKFADLEAVRERVRAACAAQNWGEPIWLETTVADPGTGQARRAVDEGAAVVCPLGGDGTVRAVAAALVGTETPLGLLPSGTGNLLARNLDLPVDSIERALVVALTGHNMRIDVGRIDLDPSGQHHTPEPHIFLVMAGIGFDAAIMAGAPEALKARVGSAAYVVSGLRNMLGPQFRARIKVDDDTAVSRRTRTVIVGNCGRLFGGLVLMPGALVDDGNLDTVVLSPRGVVGWSAVAGHVVTRQRRGHALIDRHVGKEVHITTDRPQEVQVDGDPLGQARSITATVDHLALVVRVGSGARVPAARTPGTAPAAETNSSGGG